MGRPGGGGGDGGGGIPSFSLCAMHTKLINTNKIEAIIFLFCILIKPLIAKKSQLNLYFLDEKLKLSCQQKFY